MIEPRFADAACLRSPRFRPRHRRRLRRRSACNERAANAAGAPPRRPLPEQLPRVRAEGPRRGDEVAHRRGAGGPAAAAAAADPARRRRPRLHSRQRRRRRGDGAGADLDRPRQHAASRPAACNLLTDPIFSERASPLVVRRPEAPRRAGPRARRAAAHRRGADLAQPLRPPRRRRASTRSPRRPAARRSSSCRSASSAGSPTSASPNAVELDWWQSTPVGAVEIVFTPSQHWSGRSLGDRMETLWGGYRDLRARRSRRSSPATPRTRRTSPTSTSVSPRAMAPAAASTSP